MANIYELPERLEDNMAFHLLVLDCVGNECPEHPMHRHSASIVDDVTASLLMNKGFSVDCRGNGINYVNIL